MCPRCGGSLKGERFYGPCASCCIELCQMVPPAPDARFVPVTAANGLPTTNYIGPRVDRNAARAENRELILGQEIAPEVFGAELIQPHADRKLVDVDTRGRV